MYLLSPKEPLTETIAEIKQGLVSFPEKHDKFRECIKYLGYHWEWPNWVREPLDDTIIETGVYLIKNGFKISVDDEQARNRIIACDYTPEKTKWIKRSLNKNFKDWFVLLWRRHRDDYYNEAIKVHGAKYSDGYVYIPKEYYEEVEGFAKINGFEFSDSAKELIDESKKMILDSIVVEYKEEDIVITEEKEDYSILDEFKDN